MNADRSFTCFAAAILTFAGSVRSTSAPSTATAIKGWHRHADMTLNYACVFGRVKLVVFDDRDGSSTREEVVEIFLGPENYSLVVIPPGLWNGFKGMAEISMMANCCTHEHDPSRSERVDPYSKDFPYNWSRIDQ